MGLLTPEFLANYVGVRPKYAGPLFEWVYYTKYCRWIEEEKRRETWLETIQRVVEYNVGLYSGPKLDLTAEAELMFDNIYHLKTYPAGRSLWIAGTKASEAFPESNLNCTMLEIDSIEAFCDLFHLLMVGAGVGFRVLQEDVDKLPKFNSYIGFYHKEYVFNNSMQEYTTVSEVTSFKGKVVTIDIGDSKQGWIAALRQVLTLLSSEARNILLIKFNYNNIRPAGERIKTFGGRAAGHEGLKDMFEKLNQLIKQCKGKLTPVAAMDLCNIIAQNVVVGGGRRSAQIALGPEGDEEFINAKVDLPDELNHRRMSNNSIVVTSKPERVKIGDILQRVRESWEPGFLNFEAACKRRPWFAAVNPCLTSDTWITTDKGPRQIKDLLSKSYIALVNEDKKKATAFWSSGVKKVYKLKTREGYELKLTNNHKVNTTKGWKEAKDLVKEDKLILNKLEDFTWGGKGSFKEGWLIGSLIGDGTYAKGTANTAAYLRYWGADKKVVSAQAQAYLKECVGASVKVQENKANKFSQVGGVALSKLAEQFGIVMGDKVKVTNEIEKASSEFYCGFLQGLFDADGSPQGSIEKGRSIRLAQSNYGFLIGIQRMLLRLGIRSTVYAARRKEGFQTLPDGRGGSRQYFCKANDELIIARDSMYKYMSRVGFSELTKKERALGFISQSNIRRLYKDHFTASFESLTYLGEEEVFDCAVEDIHMFDANGIIAHNCGEILGANKGNCNLSGTFVSSFVKEGELDWEGLEQSHRLAARIGLRQTNINLSLPEWDRIHKRDRLIGVSVTGLMDALDKLGWTYDSLPAINLYKQLRGWANNEADNYANEMRVPRPLLVTTVKPEGTISLLSTVSPGMHRAYAPYFIRRIKLSKMDPVCKVFKYLGIESEQDTKKPDRVVFSFPIASGAPMAANDEPALDQFNRYLLLMRNYVDHNASCTLTVGPDEWEAMGDRIHENWDDVVAIALANKNLEENGNYDQLPYEAISKEKYEEMAKAFPDLSNCLSLINKAEQGIEFEYEEDDGNIGSGIECSGLGSCPLR